ncbi:MAG: outer membrane beta-barrel protein [Capsulimonadales bacterium]|nr:outer membrane beta-barrel protein [Capsulimonadales bacterium]
MRTHSSRVPSPVRAISLATLLTTCALPTCAQSSAPAAPPITINAQVEANYTANFNKPFNGSNLYLYNTKEGQFSVNLAEIRVGKAATPESRTGFVVRLIEGEVRTLRNFNVGEFGGLPNVLEAYATFLAPVGGKDIKVDVGQFVTHVGYETIDIGTNNFFSRNFLFQFPSPFYNAGVRAAYPVGPSTTVSGFVLNRYNGTNDTGNRDVAPGFQVAQTLSGGSSLILNGLYSRDNVTYDGTQQPGTAINQTNKSLGVLDLVYTGQFGPRFKVVAEGLYRFGKTVVPGSQNGTTQDVSYNVTGGALYLIATNRSGNVAALRGEYITQSKTNAGVIPSGDASKKPNISSITASYELRSGLFPGMRTILEYRYDNANTEIFASKDANTFKKNQSTLTVGQVFAF